MSERNAAKLDQLGQWYAHHLKSFLTSLNDLFKKPLASLMTLIVIGIAVSLPAGLFVLLQNLQSVSQHWHDAASISLYLKKGTPDFKVSAMLNDIRKNPAIESAQYISPESGLRDFEQTTQLSNILGGLKQNPLPGVIVILPRKQNQTSKDLKKLVSHFQNLPEVAVTQMDLAWVQRLYAIITIGKRITYSLAILFGLGVLLIIGNTIRLTIEHHHEEMMILKLIGATDAFIRRPILYRGLLYGLFGGLFAWVLVVVSLAWLKPPAQILASSYEQNWMFQGLSFLSGVLVLLFSSALGIVGAWLAARRQLRTLN